jgi:predicted DNA-binding transcriptional regulator YafY
MMRADRLIQIILLLQTRGKIKAQILADELEVSRRTILRDIDALSIAGIPIYTDSGHGGGISLDEQYRSKLTGLKEIETQTLFISDNSRLLGELGLSDAASSTFLKLLSTLPSQHRESVDHMRQRILIDPDWWFYESKPAEFWDDLYQAVFDNQQIQILYETYKGEQKERIIEPYSLVSKSSNWYLVARREGEYRIYRVSRIQTMRVLDQTFEHLPDFDLQSHWQTHSQAFAKQLDDYYTFTLKVHPDKMVFIRTLIPGRTQIIHEAQDDGWLTVQCNVMSNQFARMIIFELGEGAIVLEPLTLKTDMLEHTQRILKHLELNSS